MARKQRAEEPCGNWMDTYGDMVTLLLTFFVMLFSMSTVNAEKWEMLVKAFTNRGNETSQIVLEQPGDGEDFGSFSNTAGGGEELDLDNTLPANFDELFIYLQQYVEENRMEASVEITKENGVIYIRFRNNIFFNGDKYDLKQSSHGILDFLGRCLKNVEHQILTVNISGHTAAIPWDEDYRVSDRMLSLQRAGVVALYLEDQTGLDPTKLLPTGYGKYFPVATNETEEGRQLNRRVDMMIVSNEGSATDSELLEDLLRGTYDADRYPGSGSADRVLLPEQDENAASSMQPDMERAAQELEDAYNSLPGPVLAGPQPEEIGAPQTDLPVGVEAVPLPEPPAPPESQPEAPPEAEPPAA